MKFLPSRSLLFALLLVRCWCEVLKGDVATNPQEFTSPSATNTSEGPKESEKKLSQRVGLIEDFYDYPVDNFGLKELEPDSAAQENSGVHGRILASPRFQLRTTSSRVVRLEGSQGIQEQWRPNWPSEFLTGSFDIRRQPEIDFTHTVKEPVIFPTEFHPTPHVRNPVQELVNPSFIGDIPVSQYFFDLPSAIPTAIPGPLHDPEDLEPSLGIANIKQSIHRGFIPPIPPLHSEVIIPTPILQSFSTAITRTPIVPHQQQTATAISTVSEYPIDVTNHIEEDVGPRKPTVSIIPEEELSPDGNDSSVSLDDYTDFSTARPSGSIANNVNSEVIPDLSSRIISSINIVKPQTTSTYLEETSLVEPIPILTTAVDTLQGNGNRKSVLRSSVPLLSAISTKVPLWMLLSKTEHGLNKSFSNLTIAFEVASSIITNNVDIHHAPSNLPAANHVATLSSTVYPTLASQFPSADELDYISFASPDSTTSEPEDYATENNLHLDSSFNLNVDAVSNMHTPVLQIKPPISTTSTLSDIVGDDTIHAGINPPVTLDDSQLEPFPPLSLITPVISHGYKTEDSTSNEYVSAVAEISPETSFVNMLSPSAPFLATSVTPTASSPYPSSPALSLHHGLNSAYYSSDYALSYDYYDTSGSMTSPTIDHGASFVSYPVGITEPEASFDEHYSYYDYPTTVTLESVTSLSSPSLASSFSSLQPSLPSINVGLATVESSPPLRAHESGVTDLMEEEEETTRPQATNTEDHEVLHGLEGTEMQDGIPAVTVAVTENDVPDTESSVAATNPLSGAAATAPPTVAVHKELLDRKENAASPPLATSGLSSTPGSTWKTTAFQAIPDSSHRPSPTSAEPQGDPRPFFPPFGVLAHPNETEPTVDITLPSSLDGSHFTYNTTGTAGTWREPSARPEAAPGTSEKDANELRIAATNDTPSTSTYTTPLGGDDAPPSRLPDFLPELTTIIQLSNGSAAVRRMPLVRACVNYSRSQFCREKQRLKDLFREWVFQHARQTQQPSAVHDVHFYKEALCDVPESANETDYGTCATKTGTVVYFYVKTNGEANLKLTEEYPLFPYHFDVRKDLQYLAEKVTIEEVLGRRTISAEVYESSSASVWTGLLVALVVGIVVLVVLAVAVVFLVVMKKRQKATNFYGKRCTPVSIDAYSMDSVSVYHQSFRKKGKRGGSNRSIRSYLNHAFDDPNGPSRLLNFAKLTHFISDIDGVHEEFSAIPVVMTKYDEMPLGIEEKNRYANVIPVPETRVPLKQKEEPTSSYINANYVKGPRNEPKYYIASQAPLENTVPDFWRMVWEQETRVVVMATDFLEKGIEKCAEYLPPSETLDCHRVYGDFQVTLKSRDMREKYVISFVQLKNLENNLMREVAHLWYTGWPVSGVPNEEKSFISFVLDVRKTRKQIRAKGPIVVHCSPGTGRTGTYIACDIVMKQFEEQRAIDVPKTVYAIRRDRAGAVQTKEQYAFIYRVINQYASRLTTGNLDSI